MESLQRVLALVVVCWFQFAHFTEPAGCVIELQCPECVPDNMPLVGGAGGAGGARDGAVRVPPGAELRLACPGGRLLAYPQLAAVTAVCDAGRYRVRADNATRHLLELGCQESPFEDVLHQVEHCATPLQGRAYVARGDGGNGAGGRGRHLAVVCFDADAARPVYSVARPGLELPLPPHADGRAPLSLLGNFGEMFDAGTRRVAERLYADDASLARRLRELLKHERVELAGQALTAARLLAPDYFEGQEARVAEFASNKFAAWGSVARGNLPRLQADVAEYARAHPGVWVVTGTSGEWAPRGQAGAGAGAGVRLAGGRFPVPRYVWAVVGRGARALAVGVLNDPFVAVSEVRGAVLCESQCGRAGWLRRVRAARAFETPLYGLAFCCGAHELAAALPDRALPPALLHAVPRGEAGLLLD